jgi:hypothetical protein
MPSKRITPIPPVGTSENSVYARTMVAAAEALGGLSSLADYFKMPRSDVLRWAIGAERPPQDVFLVAVDVLLEDNDRLRGDPGAPRSTAPAVSPPPGK